MIASVKLETDEEILLEKAKAAIRKYDVNMVVANVLHTRYDIVKLVQATSRSEEHADFTVGEIRRQNRDIEHDIIQALVKEHETILYETAAIK